MEEAKTGPDRVQLAAQRLLDRLEQAVEELLAEGYEPEQDVYLASSCTEEWAGDGAPKLVAELKRRGFTDDDLVRITTPIGLPILAETPAEIAISIAAQPIQVRALSH